MGASWTPYKKGIAYEKGLTCLNKIEKLTTDFNKTGW